MGSTAQHALHHSWYTVVCVCGRSFMGDSEVEADGRYSYHLREARAAGEPVAPEVS